MENLMRSYVVLFLALALAGCGCGNNPTGPAGAAGADGTNGAAGAAGPAATSAVDPTVAAIAAEYPTTLDPGVNCTVQQVTAGQYLSSSSPGYTLAAGVLTLAGSAKAYTQTAGFDQPNASTGGNSAVASEYQYLLTSWVNYKISCSGFLIVTKAAAYDFDVNSDDGAILTVSGLGQSFTLNNDGTHAMTDKSTALGTWLYPGVYSFNLQYAQSGAGNWGLIVSWYINNVESVIPAGNFYH
jgi:hypothetical protein